jgi:hypothetical protein
MHQLTDLHDHLDQLADHADRNDRMRTEGTHNLIEAAQAAGARRLLAPEHRLASAGPRCGRSRARAPAPWRPVLRHHRWRRSAVVASFRAARDGAICGAHSGAPAGAAVRVRSARPLLRRRGRGVAPRRVAP